LQHSFTAPVRDAEAGINAGHAENRHQEVPVAAFGDKGLGRIFTLAGFSEIGGAETRTSSAAWCDSFLFAGMSALLLLLASLFSEYSFLSLIALTPFLFRISKADVSESMRLGFLLGLAFLAVTLADSLVTDPLSAMLKLLYGTALFTLFAWTLWKARTAFGFNPIITALIWAGFELAAVKLGLVRGLLGSADFSIQHLSGLVVLFGFIIVSFIIVLLNSLLLIAVEKAVSLARARGTASCESGRIWDLYFSPGLFVQKYYLVPDVRGPPASSARLGPI
jgi:hypothetical protein